MPHEYLSEVNCGFFKAKAFCSILKKPRLTRSFAKKRVEGYIVQQTVKVQKRESSLSSFIDKEFLSYCFVL